jgi:hypothetical protein
VAKIIIDIKAGEKECLHCNHRNLPADSLKAFCMAFRDFMEWKSSYPFSDETLRLPACLAAEERFGLLVNALRQVEDRCANPTEDWQTALSSLAEAALILVDKEA